MRSTSLATRALAIAITATVILGACGDDESSETAAAPEPSAESTAAATEPLSESNAEAAFPVTTTEVPSAAAIAPAAAPESSGDLSADEQAAADAWASVFDSTATYDDKSANLEDAASLQTTIESYATAGSSMGGISLVPTDVTIDGDTATITYDVLFGGTAAYSDQTGTETLIDGIWVVSRAEFCSFMSSARNPCP